MSMQQQPDQQTTGQLVAQVSQDLTTLVRDEMRLAQAEMAQKGKGLGIGVGLFGGSGVIALYGVGTLIAAAVLGLATAVSAWLSALIIGVVLLVVAGIVAMVGRGKVQKSTPPVPEQAVEGLKQDVATVRRNR